MSIKSQTDMFLFKSPKHYTISWLKEYLLLFEDFKRLAIFCQCLSASKPRLRFQLQSPALRHVCMIMPGSTNYLIYTFITWQRCACADGANGSQIADRRSAEIGARDHSEQLVMACGNCWPYTPPSSTDLADVGRCLSWLKNKKRVKIC